MHALLSVPKFYVQVSTCIHITYNMVPEKTITFRYSLIQSLSAYLPGFNNINLQGS